MTYTTPQVVELTGATARQLQWWDEQRIVVPERDGRRRTYSFANLAEILVIEQLRRRRVSLQRVRAVLRFLRKEYGERLSAVVSGKTDHHLLLDANRIYLETSDRQIVDLLRNCRQPVFAICLSETVRELLSQITQSSGASAKIATTTTKGATPKDRKKEVSGTRNQLTRSRVS